jgi:hypothetical protein
MLLIFAERPKGTGVAHTLPSTGQPQTLLPAHFLTHYFCNLHYKLVNPYNQQLC